MAGQPRCTPGFVAILRTNGERPDPAIVTPPLRWLERSGTVRMAHAGPCVIAAVDARGPGMPSLVDVNAGTMGMAAGIVRLDGPRSATPLDSMAVDASSSDRQLAFIQERIQADGELAPDHLSGDFAFAAFDRGRRQLIAARDPFGVKGLFYAERHGHVLVASHAGLLVSGSYDVDFVAGFLLGNVAPTSHTIYSGVTSVPPGGLLVAAPGSRLRISRYWTPRPASDAPRTLPEAAAAFRERFRASVRAKIAPDEPTWAELSGGVDSSSIVVTATRLAKQGAARPLAGTMTYVDELGEGDERSFAEAVTAQTTVPASIVWDEGPWASDGELPPLTDEPSPFYPFYARERRRVRLVSTSGSRVLLSGHGSDHYLTGSLIWLADLAGRFQIAEALSACTEVAAALRTSMWRVARHHLIGPLLPPGLRYRRARAALQLPSWVREDFAKRHDMRRLLPIVRVGEQGLGSRFHDAIAIELAGLDRMLRLKSCVETVERRYPFLDRTLVELALALPREFINQPRRDKVVLREAMRDDLPEVIHLRTTKGGVDARFLKSLNEERERIDRLVQRSYLAEIGAIEPASLQRAVDEARRGHVVNTAYLLSTLALETWLAVRDGQWQAGQPTHRDQRSDAA